jgi:hypothetical protein
MELDSTTWKEACRIGRNTPLSIHRIDTHRVTTLETCVN